MYVLYDGLVRHSQLSIEQPIPHAMHVRERDDVISKRVAACPDLVSRGTREPPAQKGRLAAAAERPQARSAQGDAPGHACRTGAEGGVSSRDGAVSTGGCMWQQGAKVPQVSWGGLGSPQQQQQRIRSE